MINTSQGLLSMTCHTAAYINLVLFIVRIKTIYIISCSNDTLKSYRHEKHTMHDLNDLWLLDIKA